jgi:hypothetical protein
MNKGERKELSVQTSMGKHLTNQKNQETPFDNKPRQELP